jgi:hypothetical protein
VHVQQQQQLQQQPIPKDDMLSHHQNMLIAALGLQQGLPQISLRLY